MSQTTPTHLEKLSLENEEKDAVELDSVPFFDSIPIAQLTADQARKLGRAIKMQLELDERQD